MSKLISQIALVLFAVFSLVLVVSNMGIMNPCNSFAADGAELGITKENCAASFKKMAGMGNNEENMVAMTVLYPPLMHTWFLAAGLASLYCLFTCEAGTKEVAICHLHAGIFMLGAGFQHLNNGGLLPPAVSAFWPVNENVNAATSKMLLSWAVMCNSIGALCMYAFFASSGKAAKTKTN